MNRRDCAAQHMGPWLVEPQWLHDAVQLVRSGAWEPDNRVAEEPRDRDRPLYSTDRAGIAMIQLQGHMIKGRSSFGGTSMVLARQAIERAAQDPEVRGIMLHIDSPGGTSAGTGDLGETVWRAREYVPVHAYIEDLGASAAYWVASQAAHVSINDTGRAGSIGTVAILEDWSDAYEAAGVEVNVISSGPYKGAFAEGADIPEEHLEYAQEIVDDLTDKFTDAIQRGREAPDGWAEDMATGKVWISDKALSLGLVDAIETLDEAYDRLEAAVSGDSYSIPDREEKAMFGGKKQDTDTAAESEKDLMQRLDAIGEAFEEFGEYQDTLANRAFRAGLDAEQAEHLAGGIRQVLQAQDSDAEELREEMEEKSERIEALEAENEGLKDRLAEGNSAIEDGPGEEAGPSAEQFEQAVKEKVEEDGLSRGEAIGQVRKEHPELHEAWNLEQQG